ncbi:MAG TPA: 50S ribosomal protein L1 [Patescibacteria group bacterium]
MGKRFENAAKEVDVNKQYTPSEAIALAKKTATTKFVGNIEVHVRLGIDAKKSDQTVRTTVTLPHGTGKTKRIAAFVTTAKEKEAKDAGAVVVGGEDLIKKIKESEQLNFDIAIAEPAMMPKLAQIAKFLGPRGLMPNPKSGTVSADIGKTVKEFATGKAEFKNDESGNVHMILGKSNFPDDQILANFKSFIDALNSSRPSGLKKEYMASISINATMGPGIKVKI